MKITKRMKFLGCVTAFALFFGACASKSGAKDAPAGQPPMGMPPKDGNFPGQGQPPEGAGMGMPGGPGGQGDFGSGSPGANGGGFGGNTPPGAPGMFGPRSENVTYAGATQITSAQTLTGQTYSSSQPDQNALLISTSDDVALINPAVTKSGSSRGGDACNFYGLNAAVLVKDGSTTTISGGSVKSDADGANGIFSYGGNGGRNGAPGDGTTVIIRDTKITTMGNGSGGIMTTGGGITRAYNLDVTTSGASSAAIRTDRGGGTVTVEGGSYTSNGLGSPTIYSTADITVSNATLTSNLSEGVCIEGKNSITLNNCLLTADNTKCNGNATFFDTIMIYQSMSGDADSGKSHFTMNGGTLTSRNGHVLHVTNTNAEITLNGVSIVNEDEQQVLLSVCADGWYGAANMATVNAENQVLKGKILVGDDSTLTLNLKNGTVFEGSIDGKITNAKGKKVSQKVGTVTVNLDSSSEWVLTGNTYISSFKGDKSKITRNGYKLYVKGKELK